MNVLPAYIKNPKLTANIIDVFIFRPLWLSKFYKTTFLNLKSFQQIKIIKYRNIFYTLGRTRIDR